jgi:secondary thiamine-phosphate synthase enzyme
MTMNTTAATTTIALETRHMPDHKAAKYVSVERGPVTIDTRRISFHTEGNAHIVNITAQVHELLKECGLKAGTATVFVPGATGALTTLEFEPGVVSDFQRLFDQIAPIDQPYQHNMTNIDGNGHAHIRAGLLGPSLVVPFAEGALCLGRWQEICFVCFDNRPRERTVIVQFLGV